MVKRIIQIQLRPTPEQAAAFEKTMGRFNQACNWVAQRAFGRQLANRYALHKLYYYTVRQQFDLPAQMACLHLCSSGRRLQNPTSAETPTTFSPSASLSRLKAHPGYRPRRPQGHPR